MSIQKVPNKIANGLKEMIKEIRHDIFIIHPTFIAAESIDIQWNALCSLYQLSAHNRDVFINARMAPI
ncbi:MAG: hypothetical protein ACOH2D_08955 [Gelidibacter sp.]